MASIDDQIPRIPQTKKDEIEEGSKVDHLIDIPETNGQDPSGSQTNKSINQIFDEKFKDLDNSSIKLRTIFKVNVCLCKSNPDAYTPNMVSIGPYHKKNPQLPQLHQMEEYKLLYLRRFLGRKEGLDVESCIKELEGLKEKALKCYDDVETETDEFCQMLLLDGCFVVEFIRECCGMCPKGEEEIIDTNGCYIFRDLMLLENQLPFFVLNKLHLMTKHDDESSLAILVNSLFTRFVSLPKMTHASSRRTECNEGNIKHLLHVLHIFSCHGKESKDDKTNPKAMPRGCYNVKHLLHHVLHIFSCHGKESKHKVMPNATELSQAGVSFLKEDTRGCDNGNPVHNFFCHWNRKEVKFDIKFENGSMTIPSFKVTDNTETILRNLIAYEQQSSDVKCKYFSDFLTFMDYLIDSEKDVNLLRQKEIIENLLGDDKEVASIFNKMGTGITIYSNFYYKEECRKAAEHCKKPWNKYRATLLRNYFSNPWVGASTIAAIILLILTLIQTILAF